MIDPHKVLGVETTADPQQIEAAYNQKLADFLSRQDADPTITEQINLLDEAYEQLAKKSLAIAQSPPPRKPVDPILNLVNDLDANIQETSDKIIFRPCPFCNSPNPIQLSVCSTCGNQISRPCPNCGKQVLLGQPVCTHCNTVIRELDQNRLADATITKQRVSQERVENTMRIDALEESHRKRAVWGTFLWIGIALAVMVICAVSFYAMYYFGTQR